jgi:hypothetical protein
MWKYIKFCNFAKKLAMETKQTLEFQISQKLKNLNLKTLQQVFSYLRKLEKNSWNTSKPNSLKNLQGAMRECKASSFKFIENKKFEKILET